MMSRPTHTHISNSMRRMRKRGATPVYGGQEGSYRTINNDFVCPICFDYIDDAHMTKCGHSFCHSCIETSMKRNNRCPRCGTPIESPAHIFPNFTLMELVKKHKQEEQASNSLKQALASPSGSGYFQCQDWEMEEVKSAMAVLADRKRRLEQNTQLSHTRMLQSFLEEVRVRKEKELSRLQLQMSVLSQDCQVIATRLQDQEQKQMACPDHLVPNRSSYNFPASKSSTSFSSSSFSSTSSSSSASLSSSSLLPPPSAAAPSASSSLPQQPSLLSSSTSSTPALRLLASSSAATVNIGGSSEVGGSGEPSSNTNSSNCVSVSGGGSSGVSSNNVNASDRDRFSLRSGNASGNSNSNSSGNNSSIGSSLNKGKSAGAMQSGGGSVSFSLSLKQEGGEGEGVTTATSLSATGLGGVDGKESFAGGVTVRPTLEVSEARKKRKLSQHFEDLEKVYLDIRTNSGIGGDSCGSLDQFGTCLSKFSRYTSLRAVATLNYTHEVFTNSSSIVSSIEFNRDSELFAIAGVTKKIKVFEYGVVRDVMVDIHYPVTEMTCSSKISCLAWNPYRKHMLSSADYGGNVYIWDTSTNQRTRLYTEHEKRCWSVDFNRVDPKLLASGSDDTKVKLWDWDRGSSVMTIEGGANVCCVKFNPDSRFHLAFGSADHCVHYYDLRHPKKAVSVFRGHGKAVSYVKFLNNNHMVSASTDSQLKLWSLGCQNAVRTFQGHVNEKNFVGLATDGDYIACGSENNSMYLYYKGLSRHILTYRFEPSRRLIEKPLKDDDATEFVSAVTWKPDSNILVAANSQGLVQLLELV